LTYFFNLYHHNQLGFFFKPHPRHSSFASSSPPWRISSGFPCSLYLLSLNGFRTKYSMKLVSFKVTNIFSPVKNRNFQTAKLKNDHRRYSTITLSNSRRLSLTESVFPGSSPSSSKFHVLLVSNQVQEAPLQKFPFQAFLEHPSEQQQFLHVNPFLPIKRACLYLEALVCSDLSFLSLLTEARQFSYRTTFPSGNPYV